MNSPVTIESETSVMSSSCLPIRVSSRSNGPSKFSSRTENVAFSTAPSTASPPAESSALGDGATVDQLSSEPAVSLRGGVVGGELDDRGSRDAGIRELHGAADHGLEDLVTEGLHHTL